MIYLDNASTTKVSKEVLEAMLPYFSEEYANPSSAHHAAEKVKKEIEKAREVIAKKIHAEPEEIIFTSGGSESNALAIKGILATTQKKKIITTKIEHPSVLENIRFFEKKGYQIIYLNNDQEGFIDIQQLKKEMDQDTALVTIIHGNNEIGTVQDMDAIAKICKEKNIPLNMDVMQSFCKEEIDVKKTPITIISMSAHKIHGPKGIGALFVRKGTALQKQIFGGEQELQMRAGTENVPAIIGFAKAAELYTSEDVEKQKQLRDYFLEKIKKEIADIIINGSLTKRLCNNINISFKEIDGSQLLEELSRENIFVSMGSACTSTSLDPSHVLLAIGRTTDEALGTIRFSISKYTTKEEIDTTIKKTKEIVELLRKTSSR